MSEVRFGERVWNLAPGDRLTFGRGSGCDVRLPDDQHLSRRAGSLVAHESYLVIHNDSGSRPLLLRPPYGGDRVVEPGEAITSLPLRSFDLVLYGEGGTAVVLAVTTDAPEPGAAPPGRETLTSPFTPTTGQRRVLLALCEPMLVHRGPAARPATYAEIGERLGLSPGYVRNVVRTLREELSGHGLAGLSHDADEAALDDLRRSLAQWAVRSRWVTPDHLSELDLP